MAARIEDQLEMPPSAFEKKLEEDILASSPASSTEEIAGLQESSYKTQQIKDLAKEDINMLAGLAMPGVITSLFPAVLLAAWSLLRQSVETVLTFPQIALGIPRGHAKTTLIKLFVLYVILFTKRKFILIMSTTGPLAENILADIVDMLDENNIVKVFGNWRLGLEVDRLDLKKFGFCGRNIIIAAIGAEGSVRGLNLKNERPDVEIFDDIQSKECAESKLQSEALERWMIGTAMKAKSPRGCLFLFAGNMFPEPWSILKKLKTNPYWTKFISGAILVDGTALWEELRSTESLIAEFNNDIEMGHPEIFLSEVMNDTEIGINNRTDLSLIRPWPWSQYDNPQGKAIIIDPAGNKAASDDTVIGLIEVYDQTPGLKDLISEKLSPGNTIRRALLLALQNNVPVIAVESTAYQSTLLYWFDLIATDLGITGIYFVEVHTGNNSKNSRISDALKALTAGEIIVHPKIKNLVISQIAQWNPMKRDNVDGILDLLAYITKTVELYGTLMATETNLAVIEARRAKVRKNNSCF